MLGYLSKFELFLLALVVVVVLGMLAWGLVISPTMSAVGF